MTKSPSKPETGDQPPRDDRRQTTTESIVRQHRSLKAEPRVYQLRGGVAAFSHPPMPLPDQNPFYALIGRVAAEWAQIEHILDLTIWDLCAADHLLASCITGQIAGQYGRFNAIHALAAAKGFDKKMLDRIEHLSNTTAGLSKRRNRFVHDAWYTTGSEQGQLKAFHRKTVSSASPRSRQPTRTRRSRSFGRRLPKYRNCARN